MNALPGDIDSIEVEKSDVVFIVYSERREDVDGLELARIWNTAPPPIEQWTTISTIVNFAMIISYWTRHLWITSDITALIHWLCFGIGCRDKYKYELFHCGTPYQLLNIVYVIIEAQNGTLFREVCLYHLLNALHGKYRRICLVLNLDANKLLSKYKLI